MTVKNFSEKIRALHGALVSYKKISDKEGEVMVGIDGSLLPSMIELFDDKAEKKNSVVLAVPQENPRERNRRAGEGSGILLVSPDSPIVKPLDRKPFYMQPF